MKSIDNITNVHIPTTLLKNQNYKYSISYAGVLTLWTFVELYVFILCSFFGIYGNILK